MYQPLLLLLYLSLPSIELKEYCVRRILLANGNTLYNIMKLKNLQVYMKV
jgi:hypothetical protein